MDKVKVMSVFGTRPDAIKMAPLVAELQKCDKIESTVLVTAQHRGLLDSVLDAFGITPTYDLDIMSAGQTLCEISAKILNGCEKIFKSYKPDLVLVHGDTTTGMATALAAFYNGIKVAHIEAGLRSHNRWSPYPEEVNRLMIGRICDLHFAPTKDNAENLIRENIKDNIFITGNTGIDSIAYTKRENYRFNDTKVNEAIEKNKKIILMTAHRRENQGQPHRNIFNAVKRLAANFEDIVFVYPVHPNKVVKDLAYEVLDNISNVYLIDPIDIIEMHNLMSRSYLILTDSGGLQEEGPSFKKPVLVLRTETERPEAEKAGVISLCGVEEENVYNSVAELLTYPQKYQKMQNAKNPFGDGKASERIVAGILYCFGISDTPPCEF